MGNGVSFKGGFPATQSWAASFVQKRNQKALIGSKHNNTGNKSGSSTRASTKQDHPDNNQSSEERKLKASLKKDHTHSSVTGSGNAGERGNSENDDFGGLSDGRSATADERRRRYGEQLNCSWCTENFKDSDKTNAKDIAWIERRRSSCCGRCNLVCYDPSHRETPILVTFSIFPFAQIVAAR